MHTRIMWRFLRRLFKVTCIVVVAGMIVVAAQMARVGLFNLDDMWPFNLIFSWARIAARAIFFISKMGNAASICPIHSGYDLAALITWRSESMRWLPPPQELNPVMQAHARANPGEHDHSEIPGRTHEVYHISNH